MDGQVFDPMLSGNAPATGPDLNEVLGRRSGFAFAAMPADLRSVLFLAADGADEAADTVRDAALDLGAQTEAPVLLLDLAIPGNRQYASFAAADLLEPRRSPPLEGPAGNAVLQFERVRHTRVFVTRVTPDPAAFADITWAIGGAEGLVRLQRLFGAIVIAGPELGSATGGLTLARYVDGVVLILRNGFTTVAEATSLRSRVLQAGGRLMGTAMTDCPAKRRLLGPPR